MKPENKLKRRCQEVAELCMELGYPYLIGYVHTLGMEGEPLKAYVAGAGRSTEDLRVLLDTLYSAAAEYYGVGRTEATEFTDSCSLRTGDPEPALELETECGS